MAVAVAGSAVPLGLRQPGLLLAVGHRPPEDDERGQAGARTGWATREAPERLKERLALSQRIRDFAVAELKLPDNPSYRRYADLRRGAVVWNVVAAPALFGHAQELVLPGHRLRGYRGYFDEDRGPGRGGAAGGRARSPASIRCPRIPRWAG